MLLPMLPILSVPTLTGLPQKLTGRNQNQYYREKKEFLYHLFHHHGSRPRFIFLKPKHVWRQTDGFQLGQALILHFKTVL